MGMTNTESTRRVYTDNEATDEAVLLLTRKLRRHYPAAFSDLMGQLPEGAREALTLAENRADGVRDRDDRAGTKHRYMTDEERYGSDEGEE